jgi:hypothetical protein
MAITIVALGGSLAQQSTSLAAVRKGARNESGPKDEPRD